MTEFGSFLEFLRKYSHVIEISEVVEEETYVVTFKCGGKLLLEHSIIKCKCETADEIREWVYTKAVDKLFENGYQKLIEICGNH